MPNLPSSVRTVWCWNMSTITSNNNHSEPLPLILKITNNKYYPMNRYFYIDTEGKQKGTFSPDELGQEQIKKETLVWTQGMEQWKRADEVEELARLFTGDAAFGVREQVPSYGQAQQVGYNTATAAPQMPRSWMVESILVTILPFMFCSSFFSLLGIIAIVYAAQVESFFNRGDYAAAA